MDDAVQRFCAASEGKDIDGMVATLAPDVELVSPLFGQMVFRGIDDVRLLLTSVYTSFSYLRWGEVIGEGSTRVAVSDGRVSRARLGDAMVFELDGEGRIRRISPHLRPWLGITVLALTLGPKVARHPDVIRRALTR